MFPSLRALLSAWYRRYTALVCDHPGGAFAAMLLACAPAVVLTAMYFADVRAGLQELLPPGAPSVRAIEVLHQRMGGQAHLKVIAQSDDPAANRRFIDELAARLQAARIPQIRSMQSRVSEDRAWVERRAPLLVERARFDALFDEIDRAIEDAKVKAGPFDLGLEDEDEQADPFKGLEERFDKELASQDRFPNGYLETADGKTVVMMLWLQGSEVDIEPSARLVKAAQREIDAIRGKYPAELKVAFNGEVANLVEEHAAILSDMSLSTLLVFVLVTGLIVAYFRSKRSVLAVAMGLIPGLLFTFAIGRLLAGSLNSNTAFLGSIIAGNGINYPLIFLAYYRACDPRMPVPDAVLSAARLALPGTLGAALTASAAYGGLASSSFKGFSQFGSLGGIGMMTTWAITFVCMPIAVALLKVKREERKQTRREKWIAGFFERRRLAGGVAVGFVLLALGFAAVGAVRASREGLYEMDLRALRNRDSLATGAASWDRKMNEVFGVWLNPVVALAPDPVAREEVARELRRTLMDPAHPVAERVETIHTYVPPLDDQQARLVRLKRLAAQVDKLREHVPREKVPEKIWKYVDLWSAAPQLEPITVAEVPAILRQGLTEVSGSTDATVLLFPSLKIDYDHGDNVLAFADRLSQAKLPPGTVVGGAFLFMAEIIRLVRDEAAYVILTVCLLVSLILLPPYWRRLRRLLVTVSTVTVVAFLAQAAMVALGVKVNMLNFAAVPITIGVGADYAVNLFGAMDALGVSARKACSRMGGAILLCSLTTVVGYLSLVLAQSGALRSFGWAAVLGETMAVTTVLVVLPLVLSAREPAAQDAPAGSLPPEETPC